jgi:uncharacterized protein YjbI with pentapeptide repeats
MGANLADALLINSDCTKAFFMRADLTGALLWKARLSEAVITQEQLDAARGDDETELPAELNRPRSWSK